MAKLLELAKLFDYDSVAEMNVRGGGIDPELDAKRASQLEFFKEFFLGKDFGGACG